jgi:hypothetical protein
MITHSIKDSTTQKRKKTNTHENPQMTSNKKTKIKLGCHKSPNHPKRDMFQMNTRRIKTMQPLQTLVDEQS